MTIFKIIDMKNLFACIIVLFGFIHFSCSKNNEPQFDFPISNLKVPSSDINKPFISGETITIQGSGFQQSAEIWIASQSKSPLDDIKAQITSITESGISFIAPEISGQRTIILKQSGNKYILGDIYIDNTSIDEPFSDLEIPQSSIDKPFNSDDTISIIGKGFSEECEIWIRLFEKLSNNDHQVKITSITTASLSFIIPPITGEGSIILKQFGHEYNLGSIFIKERTPISIAKRIIKRDFSFNDGDEIFEYKYKNKRLDVMLEKMSDGRIYKHMFVYDNEAKLVAVHEIDSLTQQKESEKHFEYQNSKCLKVSEVHYNNEDNTTETTFSTLTLNENGLLINRVDKSDSYESNIKYEYDINNNKIKHISNHDNYSYTYDDKISVLSNQGLPLWYWVYDSNENFDQYAGKNNVISTNDGINIDIYEYEYDDLGYPITIYLNKKKIGEFIYELID